ncbi:MAG: outer membrane lipoprotein carrier protein LolA [Chlorobi bacterium]|nr:outer membrane lipoprotein carrier protein LolA [Chlorobiota bacterium]
MKKRHLLLSILIFISSVISAQVELTKDPEAKKVLDAVSEKISQNKNMKIKFSYTVKNRQNGHTDTQKGYVFLSGDKFKIIIPETEIISDGKSVWAYNKKDNEVTVTKNDTSEMSIFNPAKLFTAYKNGFKYLLIGEETIDGTKYDVVDLYPEDTENSPYSIIRLKINKATKQPYSVKTSGKSGIDYTFKIIKSDTNKEFPEKLFTFDKSKYPDDIEITDMR